MTDPKDKDLPTVDLEPVRTHFERWLWARDRKDNYARIEKEAREQLEEFIGDNQIATLDGKPVITWKWSNPKNGRLDQKMIREQYPDIAAICTTKEPSRSFRQAEEEE